MRDRNEFQDHAGGFQPSKQRASAVLDPAVCKSVGSAYVGSNPTPATEKHNYIRRNSIETIE
jgi:hypothetical protein